MKKGILFFVGLVPSSSVAFPEDSAAITQSLLEKTMDQGIEILKDDGLDRDEKFIAFEGLLKERCHTELMAKLVLGRAGWSKLSQEQYPEFIHTFIQMMTRSYYSKMDMADVSTVKVTYGENAEVSARKRVATASVEDDTSTYALEYKFAFLDERWGIYDLEVEGVSLLASYRSEFADYLAQHTGAELIEMLRKKAEGVVE